MKTNDIRKIDQSYTKIESRDKIPLLVEAPLVTSAEHFFDKGIETFSSSANGESIYMEIYYDTLSFDNRKIAEELQKRGGSMTLSLHSGGRPVVRFSLPPIPAPIEYVEAWGIWLANQFEDQSNRINVQRKTYFGKDIARVLGMPDESPENIKEKIDGLKDRGLLTSNSDGNSITLKR